MDENLWDQILTDQIVTGRETVCIAGPAMRPDSFPDIIKNNK